MLSLIRVSCATALAIACAFSSAFSQCPLPDQLDGGPCCTLATANLPQFPAFKQNALDICWRDCAVDQIIACRVQWSNPVAAITTAGTSDCSVFRSRVRLFDSANVNTWNGPMRMTYSRTWLEADASGQPLQVWRFLVNGDLLATASAGSTPCPVPPCAPVFGGRLHVSGYVDYAKSCSTGAYEFAWMLTHACDLYEHQPAFPRGGASHANRSYTFVGPSAGFVAGALQPSEGGGSALECIRKLNLPVPGTVPWVTCNFEEGAQHQLIPQSQVCNCGPATAPAQFMNANLFVTGACGSNVGPPGGFFLPGFSSMGIGSWTNPATYPGVEVLRWNAGGYSVTDSCNGITQNEVFFGVTTIGGNPARQLLASGPGLPLPPFFIDQANALNAGAPRMNLPYVSDRILNLNH